LLILLLTKLFYSNGNVALDSVSFTIKAGQKIGICGRTGSGKSSLISTLLRLWDPKRGDIFVDNIPITSVPRRTVRDKFICLPQDALVFPRSFQFNLDPESRVSNPADFKYALEAVGLMELVESRGGVEADVGQLSQGQQQLLALARAIIRKKILKGKCILILDEATSNLDRATEEAVREAISKEFKDNTVISVAHRIDMVKDADLIIVLENGKVAKIGTPEDVLH
jgi:ATP-binding cassette subfamily C (CFTR/MRP) protein 1